MRKIVLILVVAVFTLNACEDNIQSVSFDLGEEIEFQFGQIIYSQNDQLSLEIVEVNDSRCPSDVVCVWAGEARITFKFSNDGEKEFVLSTFEPKVDTVDNFIFTLIEVSPYPVSTKEILLEEYSVKLMIEEL